MTITRTKPSDDTNRAIAHFTAHNLGIVLAYELGQDERARQYGWDQLSEQDFVELARSAGHQARIALGYHRHV